MKRFFLLLAIFIFPSCSFLNTAKHASVDLSSVTEVSVSGNILLKLTHQDHPALEIKASDEVLTRLTVETQGSKLEIKDTYKPSHAPVIITLSLPTLNHVNASGAIKGEIDGIKTATFTLFASGSIDMKLSGNAEHLNVSGSGAFTIDTSNLLSQSIDVYGSGSGRIIYQGNPIINKSLSGTVQLIQK